MQIHETANSIERNPRILVADDYEANQKVAQLILQKAGYHVDVVENGQQALETCQQNHYDLILMDIQMPLIDGHEATRKIRELELKVQSSKPKESDSANLSAFSFQPSARAQRVPIIAMTGNAAEGSFDENQYPGMNDCIGKPLQRDLLVSMVQKWIGAESNSHLNANPKDEIRLTAGKPETNQFPLNLDRALQEFLGKKEILYGVLHEFITKTKIRIDTIQQAVKGFDYGAIVSEAHGIKGGAANLRADKLASLAADLENAGEARQPDLSAELADKLEQEFYNLEKYIRQHPEVLAMSGERMPELRNP